MWHEARHRWHRRHAASDTALRSWGTELRLDRIGPDATPDDATLTSAERCLVLLDHGRFEDALARFDITVSDPLADMIHGRILHRRHRLYLEPFTRFVHATLRSLAPWRLASLRLRPSC